MSPKNHPALAEVRITNSLEFKKLICPNFLTIQNSATLLHQQIPRCTRIFRRVSGVIKNDFYLNRGTLVDQPVLGGVAHEIDNAGEMHFLHQIGFVRADSFVADVQLRRDIFDISSIGKHRKDFQLTRR